MKEVWRDIVDYPTYQVSNFARVKRIARKTCEASQHRKDRKKVIEERIIPQRIRAGYLSVSLRRSGKSINCVVHRLVAKAFIANPNDYGYVNHINGVKTDNRLENIEWCTMKENTIHAYDLGLAKSCENSRNTKLKNKDVLDIRRRYAAGESPTLLGREFGVRGTCIGNIVKRRTWKRI